MHIFRKYGGTVALGMLLLTPLLVFGQSGSTRINPNVSITGGASVVGTLSKGSGTFVIDHPLDPENKLLFHSFVESPDVKNIYDGIAVLDEKGEAKVTLPSYFVSLHSDEYRYLVTPIGASSPNLHLKKEVGRRSFVIAGGAPDTKVSWQITAIRNDPFIEANPIIPEVEKGPDQLVEKGEYLSPELYE